MAKYELPDQISDEVIIATFTTVSEVSFAARPNNHIPYREIAVGALGWWLPLTRVLPLVGITPEMLRPVFAPENPNLPERIEDYEQLGWFRLAEVPFQEFARVLGKAVKVVRQENPGGGPILFKVSAAGEVFWRR